MSFSCVEPDDSYSKKDSCLKELWYGAFYVRQYKQFSRQKSVFDNKV